MFFSRTTRPNSTKLDRKQC